MMRYAWHVTLFVDPVNARDLKAALGSDALVVYDQPLPSASTDDAVSMVGVIFAAEENFARKTLDVMLGKIQDNGVFAISAITCYGASRP